MGLEPKQPLPDQPSVQPSLADPLAAPPKKVTISAVGDSHLKVDHDPVHVKFGGRVTWKVEDQVIPAGGSIEIKFDEQEARTGILYKGPFAEDPAPPAGRGHYKKEPRFISNKVDQHYNPRYESFWKYTVTVFNEDGTVKRGPLDPGVAIDEGG